LKATFEGPCLTGFEDGGEFLLLAHALGNRKDRFPMDETNATETLRYASDPTPDQVNQPARRLELSDVDRSLPIEERGGELLRVAQEAFAKTGSWVVFYRELLGTDGAVRRLFRDPDEIRYFERSEAFRELQEMVAALRSQDTSKGDAAEPERMITIRLPKSLHDVLKEEADEMNLSINKLCISKLLQRIDGRFVPVQQGRRRGRRPGPQGPRNRAGNGQTEEEGTPEGLR
jgi:hypothetical protein